jgi:hypothetical protein
MEELLTPSQKIHRTRNHTSKQRTCQSTCCLTKTSSISVIVVYERVLVDATTMVVGSHQPCISVELLAGQFDGRFGEVLTK